MLPSASALPSAPPASAATAARASSDAAPGSAADFLRALGTEAAAAEKAKDEKALAARTGDAAARDVRDARSAASTTKIPGDRKGEVAKAGSGRKGVAADSAATAQDGADAEKSASTEDQSTKDHTTALPTALLAALAAGAGSRTAAKSDLTKPAGTTDAAADATVPASAGTASKGKPARVVAKAKDEPEIASRDASHGTAREKTAETPDPATKAAVARHTPAAPQPAAERVEAAPAAPSTPTPSAAGTATEGQTSEVRVPLSQSTSHAAATAPALLMRVHAKEGVARSIEIRLDPAELGIVDVKLETGKDGRLSAVLSTERSDTFELLKRDSGALEAALRDAGVPLEDGAISFSLSDNGAGSDWSGGRESYAGASGRRDAVIEEATSMDVGAWRDGVVDISV